MAKKQKYHGLEVKKKGNGFFVDCGLLIDAGSRKKARELFREHADMNPGIVLTEKESQDMLETLLHILRPKTLTKKAAKVIFRKHVSEKDANAFAKEL